MTSRGRSILGLILASSLLVPELALAIPLVAAAPSTVAAGNLVIQTGGVVCDFDGCRTYGHRHRRYYRDPPIYDDPGFYDPPPLYVQPRVRRRVYVEREPIYRDPPVMLSPEHVQWCLDRYRSYNPRNNMFMVRRNVFRQCISPWS